MAIAYALGTPAETGASSVASLNVATPTLAAGDIHIIACTFLATTPTLTGAPAGYTQIGSTLGLGATSNSAMAVFYLKATGTIGAGTATLTLSGSQTGRIAAVPFKITGADTVTPIQNSATDSSGFVADTLTPTTSNAYLLGIFAGRGPAGDSTPFTFTPPSGMTEISEIITTTSSGSEVAVEVCGLQLASSSATGNKTATIATGSAPGHGGMSILLSTSTVVAADGLQVLLDDGTGSFPYDITGRVRLRDGGFTTSMGRQDEQSDVTPGQATVVLNNTDGGVTLGSTVIASPSPIRVDQRIRINEIENGAVSKRHTGYVNSWPVSWPGGKTLSLATISSADAQARAERRILRSVIEEEILADSPSAYYTLGEPEGATTAADSSGSQQGILAQAGAGADVVFGVATGPGTDGLGAATFAGGKYLVNGDVALPNAGAAIVFSFLSSSAANMQMVAINSGGIPSGEAIYLNAGVVQVGSDSFGTGFNDGKTHVFALVFNGSGASTVYLDGVLAGTGTNGLHNGVNRGLFIGGNGFSSFTGVMAHFAFFQTAPSAARLAAYSQAMLTGFAGESCLGRMTRIAKYAGIAVTIDGDVPQTTVPFVDFTGSSAADAMRDVADAEMGLAFINGTGLLPFHSRTRGPSKSTPDITIPSSQLAEDTTFTVDTQGIINYFEVTARGTGVTQVVRNATSELGDGTVTNPGHGRYSASKDYLVSTDQEALDRANWIVSRHAEPAPRVSALVIDMLTLTATQRSALLGQEPDSWIRVTGLPSQTPGGTTADFAVQGLSEARTDSSWTLTFNVVSRSLVNALIIDDPIYGAIDQYPILF